MALAIKIFHQCLVRCRPRLVLADSWQVCFAFVNWSPIHRYCQPSQRVEGTGLDSRTMITIMTETSQSFLHFLS